MTEQQWLSGADEEKDGCAQKSWKHEQNRINWYWESLLFWVPHFITFPESYIEILISRIPKSLETSYFLPEICFLLIYSMIPCNPEMLIP